MIKFLNRKTFFILLGLVLVLTGLKIKSYTKQNSSNNADNQEMVDKTENIVVKPGEKNIVEKNNKLAEFVPEKIFTKVPFTSQAPYAVWDEYHKEACEEASVIMLKYYLDGKKLNKETAEDEIQKLIKFQIKNYGDYKDMNARETVKLARDFYNIDNLKIIYDFSADDIKGYLAEGRPIIIPAAGRKLGNPYFTQPGPLYHNLVLIGYDGNTIITNDPGTKRGESYKYNIETLYDAIHDFPGRPEDIEKGKKAMIVLE